MFILRTIQDRIRIIPALLAVMPTEEAIHNEIDQMYPNRVFMNVGLVIARYGPVQKVEAGLLCDANGAPLHDCTFQVIVFQPFVDEVLLGSIHKSTAAGITVSLGFFHDIFIPAYWMLNPSRYDEGRGLWIWTPNYDDEDVNNDEGGTGDEAATEEDEEEQYEMFTGAKIRFKVKSIQFTQITNTAKGLQATTTTTAMNKTSNNSDPSRSSSTNGDSHSQRRRSSSTVLDDTQSLPPPMHIIGSICEDGLGLVSWWENSGEENEEEEVDEPE